MDHNKHRYAGMIQAVILDWAGTVIDHGSRAPVMAVLKAFEQAGVPISAAQARAPMGKAKKEHLRAILDMPEVSARWQAAKGQLPSTEDVNTLFSDFLPLQKQLIPECAELIEGALDTLAYCRAAGIRVGSTTGYTQELMDILVPLAAEQGFAPDAMICASDVSPGRPAPWMCFEAAKTLNVYPPESIVKVDDTVVGIEAGLNAGMWTVGIAATGNLVGLSRAELDKLSPSARNELIGEATDILARSGAHFVVPSIADLPGAIERINATLTSR